LRRMAYVLRLGRTFELGGIMKHEMHEIHERGSGLRIASPVDAETEAIVTRAIGCAIEVHRRLGPGFLEGIYKKAFRIELEVEGLPYQCERAIRVPYRDRMLTGQRVDLIVAGKVLVELKAVTRFDQIHFMQVTSYLKTTGLRIGLLINFRVPILPHGLKRIVL
jgi:GxxExxY protein